MRLLSGILAAMILAASAAPVVLAAAPASSPAAPKAAPPVLVVFNFGGDEKAGRQIADSIRLRLSKHGHEEEYEVLDVLTTEEAVPAAVPASAPREGVLEHMKQLRAVIAVYGTVSRDGENVTLDAACVNLIDPASPENPGGWAKRFSDSGERARGEIARAVVEHLVGRAEWVPPQYGDEPEPKSWGKTINVNGDFEKGSDGWQLPDNLTSFLVRDGPRGMVLKMNTALPNDPVLDYWRKLRVGEADRNHPPVLPADTGYGSLGGNDGAHFRSDWIKAETGTHYWLLADVKGAGAPMIFVKGFKDGSAVAGGLTDVSLHELHLTPETFAKLPPEKRKELIAHDVKSHPDRYRRMCYEWYLNCRQVGKDEYKHNAAPFPPRGGLPADVEWLQIQVYCYWPAGEYYFDNVLLYKDPAQKAPLPEEAPRTSGFRRVREAAAASAPATAPAPSKSP